MPYKTVEIDLKPEEAFDDASFKQALFSKLNMKDDGSVYLHPLRRSIDARSREVAIKVLVEIVPASEHIENSYKREYRQTYSHRY